MLDFERLTTPETGLFHSNRNVSGQICIRLVRACHGNRCGGLVGRNGEQSVRINPGIRRIVSGNAPVYLRRRAVVIRCAHLYVSPAVTELDAAETLNEGARTDREAE